MSDIDALLKHVGDMALKRRAKYIIEALELHPGDKILDAGCGPGFYIRLLANLQKKVDIVGIDIDKVALAQLAKQYAKKNVKILFADLMKRLPFPSGSFDKIICSEVAEHVPSDVTMLKELYRVLKPGGILVLTVPNHNYPLLWDPVNKVLEATTGKHIKSGFWAGIWTNHIRLYKPEEIERVVKKAKFSIEQTTSLTWWCLPFNHNLLYGGKLPKTVGAKLNSFLQKPSIITKFLFEVLALNDTVNTIHLRNSGVGVFIKARKV